MFLLIFIVVILFVIVIDRSNNNNAIDLLDKRFANGEIGEEEYLKRKAILKNGK